MSTTPVLAEHLREASAIAAACRDALKDANRAASPIEHLLVMDLLARAVELSARIDALHFAATAGDREAA